MGAHRFVTGSIAPLESIVAGGERVDVLLTLLEALGGEPA